MQIPSVIKSLTSKPKFHFIILFDDEKSSADFILFLHRISSEELQPIPVLHGAVGYTGSAGSANAAQLLSPQ